MRKSRLVLLIGLVIAAVIAVFAYALQPRSSERVTLSELARITHIHGIAVDRIDPARLLLATHHGFFVASPDGTAARVSDTRDDFMGFTPHPKDSATLYASGHPAGGGNLGFIASSDGGKTWRQLSKGIGGPVDFHQMDVSRSDPAVIYGSYGALQVSRDGGRTWENVGPAPEGLIDLAVSSKDSSVLFAATKSGLVLSKDAGRSWQDAHPSRQAASMVQTTGDGAVYAFIVGTGLVRATEPSLDWTVVSSDFGERMLLHMAADPTNASKLYAATQHGEVLASADGGKSWRRFAPK